MITVIALTQFAFIALGLMAVKIICMAQSTTQTLFGYTLGALVSGSFVAEIIFSWPGLGRLTLDAILTQDQYLVMGSVLMASVVLILGNLIADLLLAIADPRITYD